MKPKLLLSFLLFTFSFLLCPAQTPQGFNYQAIARDGSGNPIVGATIKVKLSILTDTSGFRATGGGVYLWEEEHLNVTTNAFGLFNIVLGDPLAIKTDGTAASFSLINWSLPDLYIGTKIANPSTYMVLGAAKLWSVPYALRAKETDQWGVNGADIYRQNGNVGIGTNTPLSKLEVRGGELYLPYNTGNTVLRFSTAFGNSFMFKPLDHALQIQSDHIGNPVIMYLDKSGVVGLGTATPDKMLTVKSSLPNSQIAKFADDARYIGLGRDAVGAFDLAGNPANLYFNGGAMAISTNGNVGIGTLTPDFKLTVIGDISSNGITSTAMVIGGPAPSPTNGQATFYFHHYGNIAHQLRYAFGKLYLEAAGNGWGTNTTPEFQVNGGFYAAVNGGNVGIGTIAPGEKLEIGGTNSRLYLNSTISNMLQFNAHGVEPPTFTTRSAGTKVVFYPNISASSTDFGMGIENGTLWYSVPIANSSVAHKFYGGTTELMRIRGDGNVGIGTASTTSKVVIQPPATWDDNTPLFEVRNKNGTPVLAVYNNGVRILVGHDPVKGITKGGFAIGGFDNTKTMGETVNLMTVNPDSVRFNIDNDNAKGNTKGGFAIGSFDVTKSVDPRGFMNITPGANTNSNYNTFMGFEAGKNNRGPHNTSIGKGAGMSLIGSGTAGNIFIGEGAGLKNTGGHSTYTLLLPDGSFITGFNSYGGENVAIGYYSGVSLAGDWQHTSWGQKNVLLGNFSGFKLNTGSNNVIIGHGAGQNLLTGKGNIFIGSQAGQNETTSDKLYITNRNDATPLIYGDLYNDFLTINGELTVTVDAYKPGGGSWLATSDERLKDIHGSFKRGLNEILNLNPVYFSYSAGNARNLPSENEYIGFVAQSVKNYLPEAVIIGKDGYFDLDMHVINVALVNAVKEQESKIEKQQAQIDKLEKIVEEMQAMMGKSGGK